MWDRVKLITSSVWTFLRPMVLLFLSQSGQILANAAMSAVAATAESYGAGANGSDKRDAAYRLIVADLQRQGIQLGASAINMAIEAAVQKLKTDAR